jgi:hypothetical protein
MADDWGWDPEAAGDVPIGGVLMDEAPVAESDGGAALHVSELEDAPGTPVAAVRRTPRPSGPTPRFRVGHDGPVDRTPAAADPGTVDVDLTPFLQPELNEVR